MKHITENDQVNNNLLNYYLQNSTLLSPESQNIHLDINQTSPTPAIISIHVKYYHKDYLYLLLFSILAFFILGYYLYYKAKSNLKRLKSTSFESAALIAKFSNTRMLSYAIFGIILIISFSKSYKHSLYCLYVQQKCR
jgi:hypothetical protein